MMFLIQWVPAMTLLMAIVTQELALPWSAWSVLRPDLVAIALFYWRLYRPDRCHAGLAFAIGLLEDVITHAAIGLNALTNILFILVVGQFGTRLRASDYVFLLPVLLTLLALDRVVQWGFMSLLGQTDLLWHLFLGAPVATILLAPLVTTLLIRVHRILMERPHAGR